MRFNTSLRAKGFTLIELVVGMVVFAVAMSMLLSVILPQAQRSVDPILQIRAAKLANSLLREIQAKQFDANSTPSAGCSVATCTPSANFGAAGQNRDDFSDVDDYHGFVINGSLLASGEQYADIYTGYSLGVSVIYDGNYIGVDDGNINAKLITVTVTMPNDEAISFATYRGNF